ncbi:MAG: hypothetical protein JW822_13240 [Spirochaetales bacterium]|nr:hypothetical protein [Spirochaetales bacterium]
MENSIINMMIDAAAIAGTLRYPSYAPLPGLANYRPDHITDDTIQKAKALIFQSAKAQIDPRALNFMYMAETALKNGNMAAARNFAQKAMHILKPEQDVYRKDKKLSREQKSIKIDNNHQEPVEKPKQVKHTYQDVSNDVGVSFTYPAKLTGAQSFIAVPAHEAEHVGRRVSEAVLNGERVMILVSYKIRYDARTGQPYVAGGTTRAIKISDHKRTDVQKGTYFDAYV